MRHFRFRLANRLCSAACGARRLPAGFLVAGLMGLGVLAAIGATLALTLVVF